MHSARPLDLGTGFRAALALGVVLLLGLTLLAPGSAQALAPVPMVPQPNVPLPPELDIIPDYEGQRICDPTPKPGALALRSELLSSYGQPSGVWAGISRDCNVSWDRGVSEHKDGRAIDWGLPLAHRWMGNDFTNWVTANNGAQARRMGIMYIIWGNRMWRNYDSGRSDRPLHGWTEYNGCFSKPSSSYDTTCHRDHVHISMTWHGAGADTSWYDGSAVRYDECRVGSASRPAAVDSGRRDNPSTLFDPLAGVGTVDGRPCYLDDSVQVLKVGNSGGNREITQRIRVTRVGLNAPSNVRISTDAGDSLVLSQSQSVPVSRDLKVAANGLIYVKADHGQSHIRIEGLGQSTPVGAGQTLEIPVAGYGSSGVPRDAKAVSLNVTVTGPGTPGYVRVFPCGAEMPDTSTLNFRAGETVANSVVVGLGTGGKVCVYTTASAHIVADYGGYFSADSTYQPRVPQRLLDTRTSTKASPGSDVRVSIPGGLGAAALNITVTEAEGQGFVTAYPCGSAVPGTSILNFEAGRNIANNAIIKVGSGEGVCLRSSVRAHLIADISGGFPVGSDFQAQSPERKLDSRTSGRLQAGGIAEVQMPLGSSAVAVNLTVTNAAGPGFLTAFPCGAPVPNASNLNYVAGQNVANGALVKVGEGGRVCVRTSQAADLIVDLGGSFPAASFTAAEPLRLSDTRTQRKPTAGETISVTVPESGGAVALNLTATETAGRGYLAAYPCASGRPNSSSLNFGPGETIANAIIVAPDADRKVCVYTSVSAHIIVDYGGRFDASSGFTSSAPDRLVDSRETGKVQPGQELRVPLPSGSRAAALNVTVTEPDGPGYVRVYPCGTTPPDTSSVNFERPGQDIANAIIAKAGAGGSVCVGASVATHVIVDYAGQFTADSDYEPIAPERAVDTRRTGMAGAGSSVEIRLPAGKTAAAVNLTVTGAVRDGYLTAYACGSKVPGTSSLNFRGGQTIANEVIALAGEANRVCVRTSSDAHIIADVAGHFSGSSFTPSAPLRLIDTRY